MPIDIMSPIQAIEGAAEKKLYNDQRVEQARYLADIRQQLHIMDNTSKERRAELGLQKEQARQEGQKEVAEIKANASNKSSEEKTKQEASKVEQQKEVTEQQKEVTKQQKQITKQEQEKTVQSNNKRLTANANARGEKYKANSSLASQSAVNSLQEEQNSIKENTLKRYGGVE